MNSLSDSSMTLLLLFVLVIALAITFAILSAKNKRMENFHQFSGRNPNGCFDCCGNIDWFLGPKYYKKLCPGSVPPAFQSTSAYNSYYNPMNDPENSHKHFNKLQENFSNKEECPEGESPAYNPHICSKKGKIDPYANCQCVDNKNNCTKCYPNVDIQEYQ